MIKTNQEFRSSLNRLMIWLEFKNSQMLMMVKFFRNYLEIKMAVSEVGLLKKMSKIRNLLKTVP